MKLLYNFIKSFALLTIIIINWLITILHRLIGLVLTYKVWRFFIEFILLLFNFTSINSLDVNEIYLRDSFPMTCELSIYFGNVQNDLGFFSWIKIGLYGFFFELYHLIWNLLWVRFIKILGFIKKLQERCLIFFHELGFF